MTSWRLRRAGISHVTRMHDGVNAFLSVRQPYIVDAARPPFVENEMDHELLRQHVQLATVRVGQGNEARTLLAREGAWPGDYAVPLLFVRGAMAAYDGEAAHSRARRVLLSLLAPSKVRNFVSTRRGTWTTWRARQWGCSPTRRSRRWRGTSSASQVQESFHQMRARDGAFFSTRPEGESEEDLWAGAGFDEGEQAVRVGPDRGAFPEPVQQAAPRVVNLKHSVNVEAQVTALQAEAGRCWLWECDNTQEKSKTSCALSEREREQCPRISHRRERLRAPRWKPVDTWARG